MNNTKFIFISTLVILFKNADCKPMPQGKIIQGQTENVRTGDVEKPAIRYTAPIYDFLGKLLQSTDLESSARTSTIDPILSITFTSTTTTTTQKPEPVTTRTAESSNGDFDFEAEFQSELEKARNEERRENILKGLFNKPDLILAATEELRGRDPNQNNFVDLQSSRGNAGVLPLAFEIEGGTNLFPPLRPFTRLP